MVSRVGVKLIQKKGCDICRSAKVRCSEKRPTCTRCVRLGRRCTWPPLELSQRDKRRGHGPSKSRETTGPPVPIAPACSLGSTSTPTSDSGTTSISIGDSSPVMGSPSAVKDLWSNVGFDNGETLAQNSSELVNGSFFSWDFELMNIEDSESFELFPSEHSEFAWPEDWTLPFMTVLSDHHIRSPSSLTLNSGEHHALKHYQTTFSIYRTTKNPKWSTHKLLLDLGASNSMIMHFILAVSINDVNRRKEHYDSSEAEGHFEAGARELIGMVNKDSQEDHIISMSSFLLLYLYMPKRRAIQQERIQQLSLTVLHYVKRHRLENRCLETTYASNDAEGSAGFGPRDRSVLARLIIWTYDEDVKCGFQGSGGHFAQYLTAHRERTMAVYEVSRTALKAHWGSVYPPCQVEDDDDNSLELEFLWALTALWQDINDISQINVSEHTEAHRRIEQRFRLFEKKYSSVFQKSATDIKPRSRVLINADYNVILFNALKIYYFRTTLPALGTDMSTDIETALKNMLHIIQRTFASNSSDLHDRLQWPLFLAGIETDDAIYRDWILSRIATSRVRTVLQRTLDHQSYTSERLEMNVIRSWFCDAESSEGQMLSMSNDSFLDSIMKS